MFNAESPLRLFKSGFDKDKLITVCAIIGLFVVLFFIITRYSFFPEDYVFSINDDVPWVESDATLFTDESENITILDVSEDDDGTVTWLYTDNSTGNTHFIFFYGSKGNKAYEVSEGDVIDFYIHYDFEDSILFYTDFDLCIEYPDIV